MDIVSKSINEEITRLEQMIEEIDAFLENAPEGCLKWQNLKGKTYYYQQYMEQTANDSSKKWVRKYIKKNNITIAKQLAQKHYYTVVKPIAERKLIELKNFMKKYQATKIEEIYDSLSAERRKLVLPLQMSVKEQVKRWLEDTYEQNAMYPENLRYETEQGEKVRSKSEVIIANTLYQYREDILYKYERPLNVMVDGKMRTIYPDFTVINVHTGKITYWEHAGRMDDPYYAADFVKKMNIYMANNLMIGVDVLLTFETQGSPLDIGIVKQMVRGI